MNGFISSGLSLLDSQELILSSLYLDEETVLADALQIILKEERTHLPVVSKEKKFLGVLGTADIMDSLVQGKFDPKGPITSYIRPVEWLLPEENSLLFNFDVLITEGWPTAFVVDSKGEYQGEFKFHDNLFLLYQLLNDLDFYISQTVEAVHNAVVAIDAQGRIVFFNPSAEKLLGFHAEEVLGKPIKTFFPDSLTYKALATGEELRGIPMSYGELNTKADFLPIVLGHKILGAVAVFKDITELEEVSHRLNSNEKLMATLEAVVENSYEGMVVIDDQENIVLMNQFFLDVIGVKVQDVIGKKINDISPNSSLPQTLKTGKAQFGETWHLKGRDFIIMRVPIEREGKVVGALAKTLFKNMEIAKMFAKKVMRLEENLAYYKEELGKFHSPQFVFDDIIGESPRMKKAKSLAYRASQTTSTILILGESGTGKEVFSHAIHKASIRSNGPYIKVNCAALPEDLLESELFGYEEGAFTGARKGGKPGKFELADKGTIFLDEIGDMSLGMQAKLLRVLQERELERLGGTEPIKVDVRIIAATNRDLHKMVMEHKFRLDLYYRLNVLTIDLPPLRERKEDIGFIAKGLIEKINKRLGTDIQGVRSESITHLCAYDWPGNIRELENILERAIVICDETWILPKHLALPGVMETLALDAEQTLEYALQAAEREILDKTLRRVQGNKVQAARILGIHRSVLYKKLAKYNIQG
ncbi:diguanylate cyclase [Desulfitobacterium hafniense]|uniref:Diguanylate cyclase n=1 Tax=Desulfitobacterium hafniense TaxID=49338 RepID=A0A0W1JI85_DESHA|nr:sigma-54-dependent Fis family transcriptional regulator [Desulfitobacterium hafniense]KTE91170.1 diguanylate cyclase [Desulfitobacterium hafniense]